ncbi:hypothetical protein L7F22_005327 [Adiantum nelumboides]|nr:hypothetical protein [Adiantum nelumboides]
MLAERLYKQGTDQIHRLCIKIHERDLYLKQAHSRQAGGNFSADKMAKAILVAGIWWPTLFMDVEESMKRCDDCQRTKTPRGQDDMPLRPMMGARAFAKWGIDFVGPIAPPAYRTHAQYIIVATDYLTKWVEAKAIAKNDTKTSAQFLYENIFMRFVAKAVKTTTTATSSRSTRSSKKSSSDDEKTDSDKEQDSKKFDHEEGNQKEAKAKGPSEHDPSDEEDMSTPLDRKSKKPRSVDQILLDEAMARVEARKKELKDTRGS